MRLSGDAAGYELDFGGTLLRDAEAKIEAGMRGGDKDSRLHGSEDCSRDDSRQSRRRRRVYKERGRLLDRGWDEGEKAALDDPCRREAGLPLGSLQLEAT